MNIQDQINGLKAQTFGVEVEGNNITRQKAAQVAAGFFGTNHFAYTANVNGYYTWSAWDQMGREWKFQRDVSIHGPDDQKCELVTPILRYEDMEMFLELLRQLRHAGMKSCPARGCGVHIHVGLKGLDGRDHDARSLRNLANMMAGHEEQIGRAIWIDEGRTDEGIHPAGAGDEQHGQADAEREGGAAAGREPEVRDVLVDAEAGPDRRGVRDGADAADAET